MGLDLWFPEDVARILASAYAAMQASAVAIGDPDDHATQEYIQGWTDALAAIALAFGVPAPAGTMAVIGRSPAGHRSSRRVDDMQYG